MKVLQTFSFTFMAVFISILRSSSAEDCPKHSSIAAKYKQIFIVKETGTSDDTRATDKSATAVLGACLTLQQYKNKMIEWFYRSYGLNLDSLRFGSVRPYETDDYSIIPYSVDLSQTSNKVIAGTFLDHVKYLNTDFHWTCWTLTAKNTIMGPRGTIQPRHRMVYGFVRYKLYDGDFCLDYHDRYPRAPLPAGDAVQPIDLIFIHKDLGEGSGRGSALYKGGIPYWDFTIAFPA